MQAILLKDVETLGNAGDLVEVSPGYLRNFLLPRKLAHRATPGAVAEFERRRANAERLERERELRERETAETLSRTVLTIPKQAGEDGRLYGSVTEQDIVAAIRAARGIRVDRRNVLLDESIREVGAHLVTVDITPELAARVKIIVVEQA